MKTRIPISVSRRSFIAGGSALVALAGLNLAGCNRGSSSSGEGSSSLRGVISYASSEDWSPVGCTAVLQLSCFTHVFESLYETDPHSGQVNQALAALLPNKISDYSYDVVIRNGAKFSNGQDVVADDVINSFKLNMEHPIYSTFLNFIKDVTKKDDRTVNFTLNYPFETLLVERLSIVSIFPANLSDSQLSEKPIGTGPWAFDNINPVDGGSVSFVKNQYYNGMHEVKTNDMEFEIILDNEDRYQRLQDASVQVVEEVSPEFENIITNGGNRVEYKEGFSMPLLAFNCLNAPFNDYRVRQAIFYAIDSGQLIEDHLKGRAELSTSFLPKFHKKYHLCNTVYSHDVDKAKELLQAAGVKNLEFTLKVHPSWVEHLAETIKENLKEAGITCHIKIVDVNWSSMKPVDGKLDYDVIMFSGDPLLIGYDTDLSLSLWHGDNIWTRERTCYATSVNNKFDKIQELLQKARTSSGVTQQNAWNDVNELIAEQAYIFPLLHRSLGTGYDPELLENYEPIGSAGLDLLDVFAK